MVNVWSTQWRCHLIVTVGVGFAHISEKSEINLILVKDMKNVNLISKMDVYIVISLFDNPKSPLLQQIFIESIKYTVFS